MRPCRPYSAPCRHQRAFVISRRRHAYKILAVGQNDERQLVALKSFLQQHSPPRISEFLVLHHPIDKGCRLIGRRRHQNALPRGQPIGFNHQGPIHGTKIGVDIDGLVVNSIHRRGRNSMPLHKFLRKNLAALELRSHL